MQAALEQHSGAAQLQHLLDLFVNFLERQDVALFVSNRAVKSAKRTIFGAKIGVIDVAIDLIRRDARIVLLHPEGMRLHADPEQIVGLQHLDGLLLRQSHNESLGCIPILSVLPITRSAHGWGSRYPPPGGFAQECESKWFVRTPFFKNVILKGLFARFWCILARISQECENKGVRLEFGSGSGEQAGARVGRGNTRKVTINIAMMSR